MIENKPVAACVQGGGWKVNRESGKNRKKGLQKGMRKLLEVMSEFIILILVMVSEVLMF